MDTIVQSFNTIPPDRQSFGGGKGGALSRLYQAGFPVPDGFVIYLPGFDGDDHREWWLMAYEPVSVIGRDDHV